MNRFAGMRLLGKKQIGALVLALGLTPALMAADLVVHVVGVEPAEGIVRLGVYGSEDAFEDEGDAVTVQEALATGTPVTVRIRDLPAGDYAIHGYHDVDGDRNFDHMLGLLPAEGYGYSVNNDLAAPENFANARFSHGADSDTEITVYMRYCGSRDEKTVGKTLSCWFSLSP